MKDFDISPLRTTTSSCDLFIDLDWLMLEKLAWSNIGTAFVDIIGDNTWASYIMSYTDWLDEPPPIEVWDKECPTEDCDADACSFSLVIFVSEEDMEETCFELLNVDSL